MVLCCVRMSHRGDRRSGVEAEPCSGSQPGLCALVSCSGLCRRAALALHRSFAALQVPLNSLGGGAALQRSELLQPCPAGMT